MNREQIIQQIKGTLSLRAPQAESLQKLALALDQAPAMRDHSPDRDLVAILDSLKTQFPTLQDFEREFPSLCFALATGVGKTRLMGAFITYLHLGYGINNFFVLAPNLTIYNKLIQDFTPNTPKYVFKGIDHFAIKPPEIVTGDNYEYLGKQRDLISPIRINVFNISKINSEVRGGKEPRIKRMREVLGDSYFDYLAALDDLVLLMDESHRYRATAGVKAINELKPIFGLELTATPFVESTKGAIPFKNVVMDYPLARAMEDGFVKEPAVVTQRNFNPQDYSAEELERIKLEDGIRLHELTKVELLNYSRDYNKPLVKPFMLIIARDTTHASQLLQTVETLMEGRYKGKVLQVDSSKSGAEEEQMITRLLAVESVDEPTEIVIHVNMLKEGWDVTNLYTIVPLRAANARTLIEQSIGRGLRLPYGKRTGCAEVDRLNIVAHDRFQEIIDEANRGDSPLRLKQVILERPEDQEIKVNYQITSHLDNAFADAPSHIDAGIQETISTNTEPQTSATTPNALSSPRPTLSYANAAEKAVLQKTLEVSQHYATQPSTVPNTQALLKDEVQQAIAQQVLEALKPVQSTLFTEADALNVAELVNRATQFVIDQTIDIPRISVRPTGEVTTGVNPFKVSFENLRLQPSTRELVGQELRTNEQFKLTTESHQRLTRLEDYIVGALIKFDDIDYFTQSELLYGLATQAVEYFKSYLTEDDAYIVLNQHSKTIAREIHAQMQHHAWERAAGYEVVVSRGFTPLKPCNFTANPHYPVRSYRETVNEVSKIKQMLFSGFTKCLYPQQKFDSDTERRFAVILERDALKWFKPVKGQFDISYKQGAKIAEYIPDFVAETEQHLLMIETKAANELQSPEVLAKAQAAKEWCKHASDYASQHQAKAWKYLIIAHDQVQENKYLVDYVSSSEFTNIEV
ncbi:MAG: DEAD/DEAH box helicase family protein [Thiofilum sp.]|uniref:DEAD/DEAH box helicase n=1 Tax=Thiofilum sp. TaxID=2212733 RepID=UPI0025E5048A|nr:DEAD/DEAH box helicase family protein [Thiofilum sp.]MBK8454481.1 DEAD/DEAH box helicase family protein [Thiofilum sp.]